MLRIIQNSSAAGAKSYYSSADYYTEGQELVGRWRGLGAERLGLSGPVRKDAWDTLCDNRDPRTGLPLTVRQKRERSVGYDFNFHVPKSVSLLYALTEDERILNAFRESVDETMRAMESEMKTRVRRGGRNEDRTTGNMVWGEFIHLTSRPVGGVPDPHLHAHCFVHNATFDEAENRWKAGNFRFLKQDAPYFEAAFHSRLARRMAGLGMPVERTRTGWELSGLDKPTLDKFSRRTSLIEERARAKGIADPAEKSELGAKTRERKQQDLTMDELRALWLARLDAGEQETVSSLASRVGSRAIAEDPERAEAAAREALEHCFDRKSVVPERELLAQAMKRSVGKASVQTSEAAVRRRDLILAERGGRRMATTAEVLAEERRMIAFARAGRGTSRRLGRGAHRFTREWLNADQRRAVEHVLDSVDRVILLRGKAGTGKTTMMSETVEAIQAGGTKVFTFAPSADASRGVLRSEGFRDAETVARLLKDERLHEQVRGQVIWVDEAGLLGVRTTAELFDLVGRLDARLVLSGDTRQHSAVERGAALRLLETEAGLVPAEIRDIQRQRGAYKQAIAALGEGRTEDGFCQLDRLGWIAEVGDTDRYKLLAHDYVATVVEGKSGLVVSPTHLEGEYVTDEIRTELRNAGLLGREQRQFRVLENARLTPAERRDRVNYEAGDVIVFHQNGPGFRKGERRLAGFDELPLEHAERFDAFHAGTLAVSVGDVLRVTRNGTTADGTHRLNNGSLHRVAGFTPDGDIQLQNGWAIGKDFGHLAHGYVVTSHASQGKTVDRIFIGQSSHSFAASSREQFYVSASRGRDMVKVYTDDRAGLMEAVCRSDARITATEFVSERERREHHRVADRVQPDVTGRRESASVDRLREGMNHER